MKNVEEFLTRSEKKEIQGKEKEAKLSGKTIVDETWDLNDKFSQAQRIEDNDDVTGGDSFATATEIKLHETNTIVFEKANDKDYFKINVRDVDDEAFLIETVPYGDYAADIYIFNEWKERVGYVLFERGSNAYIKIFKPSSTIYIRVDYDGKFTTSPKQRYDLIVKTIPIVGYINKSDISTVGTAYDLNEGDHVCGTLREFETDYYQITFEEAQKIRFCVQPEVDGIAQFKMSILDKNLRQVKYITAEDSTYPLMLEVEVQPNEPYYIELKPHKNSSFEGDIFGYLLYTERVGVGGGTLGDPSIVEISSVKPVDMPPYLPNTLHDYEVQIKNVSNHTETYNIEARLREEHGNFKDGFFMGESGPVQLSAGQTKTVRFAVRHAKTGFKDMVFQEKYNRQRAFKSVNVEVGLSAGGYNINSAISQLKTLEAFIAEQLKIQNGGVSASRQEINKQVILVVSELLYSGWPFSLFIETANTKVKKAVENTHETITNEMINNTILRDATGRAIDWVHMFAVLAGCAYPGRQMNNETSGFFTGWLGDILSEVPNVHTRRIAGEKNNTVTTGTLSEKALKVAVFEKCSQINTIPCSASVKDLEADIDAVVIYSLMKSSTLPISSIIQNYYSSVSTTRYQIFKTELCRVGDLSTFEAVVSKGVRGKYDGHVDLGFGMESDKLANFKDMKYRVEIGRLFVEYINSNGRIVRGSDLKWNNTWE